MMKATAKDAGLPRLTKTTKRRAAPAARSAPWPSEHDIRVRAYAVFEQRGSSHDRALDDWLQAERELLGECDR